MHFVIISIKNIQKNYKILAANLSPTYHIQAMNILKHIADMFSYFIKSIYVPPVNHF